MVRRVTGDYVMANSRLWDPYGSGASGGTATATSQVNDNSSPLGLAWPMLIGTGVVPGKVIVDIDQMGEIRETNDGKLVANIVLGFLDTALGGTASLLWLKANDEYVYRAQALQRSLGSPMAEYGGDQTALDPLVESYLPANKATYWPELAYIVLEDFDLTPYSADGVLPQFTAAWSTNASASSATRAESTITFSDLGTEGDYDNRTVGYDGTQGLVYLQSQGAVDYLHTIDLDNNVEVRRATLPTTERFNHIIALSGSPYVVCTSLNASNSNLYCARLIDSRDGTVLSTLNAVADGGGDWEMDAQTAVLIQSDTATKYAIFGYRWASVGINPLTTPVNDGCVMLVDITNGTLEFIAHPYDAPLRSASVQAHLIAWAWKPPVNGVITAFFVESGNGTIYKVEVTTAGASNVQAVSATGLTDINGLAYDTIDDTIVYSRDNGYIVKINLSGTVQYTKDNSALTYLVLNRQDNGDSGNRVAASVRPGYAAAIRSNGDTYIVDLKDGSAALINTDDWSTMFYDQYRGFYGLPDFYTGTWGQAGAISRYALGDATPTTVDAADILTSLVTYFGDYTSGDITFEGFVGDECYGFLIDTDTTIDACVREVCDIIGIRERHDEGKITFSMPPRDGNYAVDVTLTDADIVFDDRGSILQRRRDQDAAPLGVEIEYYDYDVSFNRVTQGYRRPNGAGDVTNTNRVSRISTRLTMTASQAIKQAYRLTYESEASRRRYEMRLMPKQFATFVSGIIQFTYGPNDDFTVVGEVWRATLHPDYSQSIEVIEYQKAIDNSQVGQGITTVAPTNVATGVELLIVDSALHRFSDDLAGSGLRSYAVLIGQGNVDIPPSVVLKSTNGYDFEAVGTKSNIGPVTGTITAISRNHSNALSTDFAGSLSVQIASGDSSDLTAKTDAGRYTLANLAACGAPGRWVLVAFGAVTVSEGVATLSKPIWGVNGTDVYLSQLAVGDRFVNLEQLEEVLISHATSLRNTTGYYKGGWAGYLIASYPTQKKTLIDEAEKPWQVVSPAATVVSGGVEFSFSPQERLGIWPVYTGAQVAGYSEGGQSYEIDILADGSPTTVLRTLTGTSSPITWTNAQIAEDFGTLPSSVDIEIYQISKLGYRGHKKAATLTISDAAIVTADTTLVTADSTIITADAA